MPIYEYLCEKCDTEFEREQRISDDPVKTCPHCRSRKVKRLISQTSFVLKGSGWYSDLYSSAGGKKSESADTTSGTDKSPSSDTSDAKPKPSSESKSDSGEKPKPKAKSKEKSAA